MKRSTILVVLASSLLATAGCATLIDSAIDSAANKTGETVGDSVGQSVGNAMVRAYTPQMMNFYTQWLFTMAFYSGSYQVTNVGYQPGDYTRWNITGGSDSGQNTLERARLADDAQGHQWWKIKYHDAKDNQDIILEALLDPTAGKVLRMRGKFPDDKAPKEMPVNDQNYYTPPQKLTPESIKGATVDTASVTVPAGTYTARHVRYGSGTGGAYDWWLVDSVPGGMVKYSETASGGSAQQGDQPDANNWTVSLLAVGHDAKDELGIN